jgi:asparagine synthase (glutamine-hydrolysing)
MCGIAGFITAGARLPRAQMACIARSMGDQLFHRGPDSEGVWADEIAGVALAHRRLAILDLSSEGAQPMLSESGRFIVSFNGEIYNYGELREELITLKHDFRGGSDTEVLLAAAEQWGIAGALQRFNGMFAFALWDREERLLHLARDRMGEKPLYYASFGSSFLFASELKALRAHEAFDGTIDRDSLALYMRFGYVPAPRSIHAAVWKLLPGGLLTVSPRRIAEPALTRYWSHEQAFAAAGERPFRGAPREAVAELESLLANAVKLRMHADVPLGAFLSGGVDSSTVVALMQAQSARPVRTFTVGFDEGVFNEAGYAKAVARHLGTEHTEICVTPRDALEVIPRLPVLYDEPFADSSQIPTHLVSRLTRRHVTVSLSGDGGDELFCGYTRYAWSTAVWRSIGWIPPAVRMALARTMDALPKSISERTDRKWAERRDALRVLLRAPTARAAYREIVSRWSYPERLVIGSREPATDFANDSAVSGATFADWMMWVDALTYLPDDILTKVDRASMGVSLEARVPLLDHRLVELAWRLPIEVKRRGGETKWVLRQILYRYVPRSLIERPKRGFEVPIEAWLRGPLRDWACDLLSEDRLRREGYLDPAPIQAALREHLSARRERSFQLWTVLMFQAWLEEARTASRVRGGAVNAS